MLFEAFPSHCGKTSPKIKCGLSIAVPHQHASALLLIWINEASLMRINMNRPAGRRKR